MRYLTDIIPELYPHPPILGWCRVKGQLIRWFSHTFYGLCAAGADPSEWYLRIPADSPLPLGFPWRMEHCEFLADLEIGTWTKLFMLGDIPRLPLP